MKYNDNLPDYIPELFILFSKELKFDIRYDELVDFFIEKMTSLKCRRRYKTQKSMVNCGIGASGALAFHENYIDENFRL